MGFTLAAPSKESFSHEEQSSLSHSASTPIRRKSIRIMAVAQ